MDKYTAVKVLYLESNGLKKIENLEPCVELRCLYLQQNLISTVENISHLKNLVTLDLSNNCIQTLSNLRELKGLQTLNASKNAMTTNEDIAELSHCPVLNNVDLSGCKLDCPEGFVDVFKPMVKLNALKVTGNPVISKLRSFRKTMITQLPQLAYLDRPIFEAESVGAKAWAEGGAEAEVLAKENYKNKKHEEDRRQMNEFRAWQKKVRARKLKEIEERKKLDPAAGMTYGVQENGVGDYVHEQAQEREPDEEARKEAEAERALVEGDGVLKMGQNFWANGNPELRFDAQVIIV